MLWINVFTSVPTHTSLSAPSSAASTHHFLRGQSRGTRVCVCERERERVELTTNGSDLKAFFADKKCELMHMSVCSADVSAQDISNRCEWCVCVWVGHGGHDPEVWCEISREYIHLILHL